MNDNDSHLKNLGALKPNLKDTQNQSTKKEPSTKKVLYSSILYDNDSQQQGVIIDNDSQDVVVDKEKKIVTFCKRYIGGELKLSFNRLGASVITALSPMKSGKTTAAKRIIESMPSGANFLFISPRILLNRALASDLGFEFYQTALKESDGSVKAVMVKRMTITPNSLVQVLREFPNLSYDYVFIDESETVSSMLVSKATDKKTATLETLINVVQKAGRVAFMDAHAGVKTAKLVEITAKNRKCGMMINTHQAWGDYSADIIVSTAEKGRDKEKENSIVTLFKQDLRAGIPAFMCSSSAKFCHKLHEQIKSDRTIPDDVKDKIALITSSTKDDDGHIELIENPDLITKVSAVIASPSISIGNSYNPEHFHRSYGHFAPNNERTGEPDDGMQAIGRPRNLKAKKWVFTLPERGALAVGGGDESRESMMNHIMSRIDDAISSAQRPVSAIDDTTISLIELFVTNQRERRESKNNYYDRFTSRLDEMGVEFKTINASKITIPKSDEIAKNIAERKIKITEKMQLMAGVKLNDEQYKVANAALKANAESGKAQHKVLEEAGIIKEGGKKLTDQEYQTAKAELKFNPKSVDESTKNAMERYRSENKLLIDFDNLKTKEEVNAVIKLLNEDAAGMCRKREIGADADKPFIKRYSAAMLHGVGEGKAFKKDVIDNKLNFIYHARLYQYALSYKGEAFTQASVKHSPFHRWVVKHGEKLNSLGVASIPKNFKKTPAAFLRKLIKEIGFNVQSGFIKKGKRSIREWRVEERDDIQALLQRRKEAGQHFVDRTNELLDSYGGVGFGSEIDRGEFSAYKDLVEHLPTKLGLAFIQPPHVVAILKAFDSVPKSQRWGTADKFVATAKSKSINAAIDDLVSYSDKVKKAA